MLISHLDFKGVLPRTETLSQLLQDTKNLGYDAVLVEYEDIFPFENIDVALNPQETWTRATLDEFVAEAARLELEIVPLQQCLGHLEWVFRWNHLRAWTLDPKYPSVVDFNNPQAREMVLSMLRQIIAAHPHSRFIHVGMDEAHSLLAYAKSVGRDPLEVYLEYLDAICDECEKLNVKPVVWGDMFEDNISPRALELMRPFADRFIFCDWDYDSDGERQSWHRCNGVRASRVWRERPTDALAPAWTETTKLVEDLEPAIQEILAPHFDGETFAPLFWSDVWQKLGFTVWGTSSARTSGDFAVLPDYIARNHSVRLWNEKMAQGIVAANIVTSWARGTTFCPPIFSFDATWPVLEYAARTAGKNPAPFFAGIDAATQELIFNSLGRCHRDWRIEISLADQMDALAPQVSSHRHEWLGIALLARVKEWQRRAAAAQDEVEYFAGATEAATVNLIDAEWQRRLDEQEKIAKDGDALRDKVQTHFAQTYYGAAFEEWLRDIFDAPRARMLAYTQMCRDAREFATRRYEK